MIVCAASTSKDTGNEDLNTDTDQNHAAQNGCFPGKAGTEALTDAEPAGTDNKSYSSDNETRGKGLRNMIFRNGETYRQRVNGGCHALHQQCTGFQVSIRMLRIAAADSFEQHLSADEQEQHQRNPRDSTLERDKCLCNTSIGRQTGIIYLPRVFTDVSFPSNDLENLKWKLCIPSLK